MSAKDFSVPIIGVSWHAARHHGMLSNSQPWLGRRAIQSFQNARRDQTISNMPLGDSTRFAARFSRYRPMLLFIATRILSDPELADAAIENCRRSASRNPPRFKRDGAFACWLVRVLIDEALAFRGQVSEAQPAECRANHYITSPISRNGGSS